MFDKVHAARLTQLADHLESGKLGHDLFDFNTYHNAQPCGTSGCAIGECPTLWPRHWEMTIGPILRDFQKGVCSIEESACWWFGIDEREFRHLFMPYGQEPRLYGGTHCHQDVTRYEVAANIRAFLEVKRRERQE
jgi:hypothetical protein